MATKDSDYNIEDYNIEDEDIEDLMLSQKLVDDDSAGRAEHLEATQDDSTTRKKVDHHSSITTSMSVADVVEFLQNHGIPDRYCKEFESMCLKCESFINSYVYKCVSIFDSRNDLLTLAEIML